MQWSAYRRDGQQIRRLYYRELYALYTVNMHQFALMYGATKRVFMSRDHHVTTPHSFLYKLTSTAAVPINAKRSLLVSKLIYTTSIRRVGLDNS